jgi:hypothetical protein
MSTPDDNSNSAADGAPPSEEAAAAPPERTVQSYFAETTRKLEQQRQEQMALSQKLEQALQALNRPQASNQPASLTEEQIADLAYKDPAAYARIVKSQAKEEAAQMIDQRLNQQQATQSTMAALINDYPELSDQTSDLSRKAVEIYNSLDPSIRSNPVAYRTAVREAAAEVGVLPKSKRQARGDDGSFSLGASSSGSSGSQRAAAKKEEVDQRTLEFAERVGMNIRDPKKVEALKSRAKRNYGKWS